MPCEKCFSVQCLYWELLIAHVSPLQTQGNRDLVGEISNICSGFVTLRSPTHLLVGKLSFKPNQAPILHFSCVSLFEQILRCMSGLFGLFVCGGSCPVRANKVYLNSNVFLFVLFSLPCMEPNINVLFYKFCISMKVTHFTFSVEDCLFLRLFVPLNRRSLVHWVLWRKIFMRIFVILRFS